MQVGSRVSGSRRGSRHAPTTCAGASSRNKAGFRGNGNLESRAGAATALPILIVAFCTTTNRIRTAPDMRRPTRRIPLRRTPT
ncbi:hypothetical protein OH687_36315 [Burkholderia anthina]|nr:hypothetical protein OH687_36315 [Burkholderia anthina]